MATMLLNVCLALLVTIASVNAKADPNHGMPAGSKLEQLSILWRHGDRSPVSLPQYDTNKPDSWPQGLGELTTRGMLQQYALGKDIAMEYATATATMKNFIDPTYNQHQIRVRSTDVNRTLLSAYSNLAGLYAKSNAQTKPDDKNKLWPSNWSPVPVHTVDHDSDYLLSVGYYCPSAYTEQKKVYDSAAFKKLSTHYEDLFKALTKYAGPQLINGKNESWTLETIYKVWDALYIEKYWKGTDGLNIKPPAWIDTNLPKYKDTLFNVLSKANFEAESYYIKGKALARLRGGPLLKEIASNMNRRIKCKTMDGCGAKYNAYSAHDTTILAFLRTLNDAQAVDMLNTTGLPKYASAVSVELWSMPEQMEATTMGMETTTGGKLDDEDAGGPTTTMAGSTGTMGTGTMGTGTMGTGTTEAQTSPMMHSSMGTTNQDMQTTAEQPTTAMMPKMSWRVRVLYHMGDYYMDSFDSDDMQYKSNGWMDVTDTISGCEKSMMYGCSYEDFMKRSKDYMPGNIYDECNVGMKKNECPPNKAASDDCSGNPAAIAFAVIFGVATAVLGGLLAFFWWRQRRN